MIESYLETIFRILCYVLGIVLNCCMIYALPQITYEFVNNYRKSHIQNEEIHRKRMEKLEEETRRNRMKKYEL